MRKVKELEKRIEELEKLESELYDALVKEMENYKPITPVIEQLVDIVPIEEGDKIIITRKNGKFECHVEWKINKE